MNDGMKRIVRQIAGIVSTLLVALFVAAPFDIHDKEQRDLLVEQVKKLKESGDLFKRFQEAVKLQAFYDLAADSSAKKVLGKEIDPIFAEIYKSLSKELSSTEKKRQFLAGYQTEVKNYKDLYAKVGYTHNDREISADESVSDDMMKKYLVALLQAKWDAVGKDGIHGWYICIEKELLERFGLVPLQQLDDLPIIKEINKKNKRRKESKQKRAEEQENFRQKKAQEGQNTLHENIKNKTKELLQAGNLFEKFQFYVELLAEYLLCGDTVEKVAEDTSDGSQQQTFLLGKDVRPAFKLFYKQLAEELTTPQSKAEFLAKYKTTDGQTGLPVLLQKWKEKADFNTEKADFYILAEKALLEKLNVIQSDVFYSSQAKTVLQQKYNDKFDDTNRKVLFFIAPFSRVESRNDRQSEEHGEKKQINNIVPLALAVIPAMILSYQLAQKVRKTERFIRFWYKEQNNLISNLHALHVARQLLNMRKNEPTYFLQEKDKLLDNYNEYNQGKIMFFFSTLSSYVDALVTSKPS